MTGYTLEQFLADAAPDGPGESIRIGEMCEAIFPLADADAVTQHLLRMVELMPGLTFAACMKRATELWAYECEHGHIASRQVCGRHVPDAETGPPGCRACYSDGHECPMTFSKVGDIT